MTDLYLPRPRRFDEVAAAILARIRSGELQAGDRLPPERKLVEEFGVSRTAVREALRSLAAQGLIDSHVGRGTFVRRPTLRHLAGEIGLYLGRDTSSPEQVRSARAFLEKALAQQALANMTSEAGDALAAAHASGSDEAYFCALATAAGEPLLGALLGALAILEGTPRVSQKASRMLVAALRARDAEAVQAAFAAPRRAATPLAA